MNIETKDAALTATGEDTDFPGTFQVILSAPTKDRDGDTLLAADWKKPLPDRINFDMDHGMSVATTVGSGVPSINSAGQLVVHGTFSSLPRAQECRTLVKEGHIDRTSVTFMSEPSTSKDGKPTKVREVLSGAFVAIPSNREAVVLSAKGFEAEVKAGARNARSDAALIQSIHDASVVLGAVPADGDPTDLEKVKVLLADVDIAGLPECVVKAFRLLTILPPSVDLETKSSDDSVTDDSVADDSADLDAEIEAKAAQYRAISTYVYSS